MYLSVTTALASQAAFDKYISTNKILMQNEYAYFGIAFISSVGIFGLLFTLLTSLFKTFFWKIFNRRYYIDGTWDATITKTQGEPSVLYGKVVIEQTYNKVHFSAQHYSDKDKKETWSHWDSTNVFFRDGNIEVYWEVTRMNGEVVTGKITFKIDGGRPPKEMNGIFVDNLPSNSLGHMRYTKI